MPSSRAHRPRRPGPKRAPAAGASVIMSLRMSSDVFGAMERTLRELNAGDRPTRITQRELIEAALRREIRRLERAGRITDRKGAANGG